MSTLAPPVSQPRRRPPRPTLYSSAIQQVLVLQEEDTPPSDRPPQSSDPRLPDPAKLHAPSDPPPAPSPSAAQRPWHTGLHSLNPNPPSSPTTRSSPHPSPAPHPHDRRRTLWRVLDRSRTRHGILVLCLHIGVDPPDIIKPNPCARLQCWHHPQPEQAPASLRTIAASLKAQYERWADRDSKLKVCSDPTDHDLKKACSSLRRSAHDQRILFHYNGHGVPRPTANGEIWVFNADFSQYIPLNIFDLNEVLGSPALYIFDCHSAGTVLNHFHKLRQHLDRDWQADSNRRANSSNRSHSGQTHPHPAPHLPPHHRSVFLAACADGEMLPLAPHVPADLFTSCLTTPIKTALRWFARRSLVPNVTTAMLDRIPGKYNLRSSPLGDLEYVFTAVSDAIAWNVLSRDLFKRLFRQDNLLASLMRNFLLAQRILRSFGCDPVSYPEIPATHNHPLWYSFDLAMENLLSQLPTMLAQEDMQRRTAAREAAKREAAVVAASSGATAPSDPASSEHVQGHYEMQQTALSLPHRREDPMPPGIDPDTLATFVYRPSSFFDDQMKAFDVWLDMGPDFRDPPEQLPVMLQVLLSPAWRVKALQLISRYMQTGPMAVDEALSVGVFPYMSQLLKNHQVREIRNDLVFIWSKILALDDSCRVEIVKSEVDEYFVRFLASADDPKPVYLACAMFVLSVVARDHADRCQKIGVVDVCVQYLSHSNSFVRRWACLCLSEVVRRAVPKTQLDALANDQLIDLLRVCAVEDFAPDVRAAAVSTLNATMAGVLRHVSKDPKPELHDRPSPSPIYVNGSGPIVIDSTVGGTDLSASSTTSSGPSSSPPPVPPPQPNLTARSSSSSSSNSTNVTALSIPPVPSKPIPQATTALSPTGSDSTNNLSPTSHLLEPNRIGGAFQNAEIQNDYERLGFAVPPYSKAESDALLKIGVVLSSIARRESSVLVRREVAIAVAELEKIQRERFVHAALLTEMSASINTNPSSDSVTARCETVYRNLWATLSELAFDPHPVDAAIARRSYDKICDAMIERATPLRTNVMDGVGTSYDLPEQVMFADSPRQFLGEQMLTTERVPADVSVGDSDPVASAIATPDLAEPVPTLTSQDTWRTDDGAKDGTGSDNRWNQQNSHRQEVQSTRMRPRNVNRTFASSPSGETFYQRSAYRRCASVDKTPNAAIMATSPNQPPKYASLPPHPPLIRDRITRQGSGGWQRSLRSSRAIHDSQAPMVSVHVRSSSGSFDLTASPLAQTIPTGTSLHIDTVVDHLSRTRCANASGWGRKECDDNDDTLSEPGQMLEDVNEGDRAGSVPNNHLPRHGVVRHMTNLVGSFSPSWFGGGGGGNASEETDKSTARATKSSPDVKQGRNVSPVSTWSGMPPQAAGAGSGSATQMTMPPNTAAQTTHQNADGSMTTTVTMTRRRLPKSMSSLSGLRVVARPTNIWPDLSDDSMNRNDVHAISPPRPPRRTHSYSVLNAVTSLTGSNRVPLFPPSERTSYFAVMEASEDTQVRERVPAGYSQLLKSGEGNAALSLYEWSSAYISRAEVEASSLDDSREEEAIPKYATLWSNINRKTGSQTVAERLRKFALLGKGDDVIGMEEEQMNGVTGDMNYELDDDHLNNDKKDQNTVDDLLTFNNHNNRNSNTNTELTIGNDDTARSSAGPSSAHPSAAISMPMTMHVRSSSSSSSQATAGASNDTSSTNTPLFLRRVTSSEDSSSHHHNNNNNSTLSIQTHTQNTTARVRLHSKSLSKRIDTRHEFAKAKQLSLHAMGAGGGVVSALAFLPRDLGIGDDQLVATGDTHGAVGVYDARTGKCQVAFGIPVPPGVREEGVSSILCLNPHGDDNDSSSSHSALILAGSLDGRVAVFKNDFSRPNDFRIMSTFQASGRTTMGKVLMSTWRQYASTSAIAVEVDEENEYENENDDGDDDVNHRQQFLTRPIPIAQKSGQKTHVSPPNSNPHPHSTHHNNTWPSSTAAHHSSMMDGSMYSNSDNDDDGGSHQRSYVAALKQHGKGLVLAFNPGTAHLAAGGLDGPIVRVWNLESERCAWEGRTVDVGHWPTAVTMWKKDHPSVFVVGSSHGVVTLIDMRARGIASSTRGEYGHGSEPIVSIGTCVGRDDSTEEVIVSADYGGHIAFWDARWNHSTNDRKRETNREYNVDVNMESDTGILGSEDHDDVNVRELGNVRQIKAHDSSLTTMCVHRSGQYIASGSLHGVKIFGRDLRHGHHTVVSSSTTQGFVFGCGSEDQPGNNVSDSGVYGMDGVNSYPGNGNRQQQPSPQQTTDRLQPVTALAFQHETSLLAIACMNGAVMVYGKERDLFPGISAET